MYYAYTFVRTFLMVALLNSDALYTYRVTHVEKAQKMTKHTRISTNFFYLYEVYKKQNTTNNFAYYIIECC